jgi:hypothetical protein
MLKFYVLEGHVPKSTNIPDMWTHHVPRSTYIPDMWTHHVPRSTLYFRQAKDMAKSFEHC